MWAESLVQIPVYVQYLERNKASWQFLAHTCSPNIQFKRAFTVYSSPSILHHICALGYHTNPEVIIHCGKLILLQDLNSGISYHGPLLQYQLCSNGWSIIKLTGPHEWWASHIMHPSQYVALTQSGASQNMHTIHQCPDISFSICCMEALYAKSAWVRSEIDRTNTLKLMR